MVQMRFILKYALLLLNVVMCLFVFEYAKSNGLSVFISICISIILAIALGLIVGHVGRALLARRNLD